MTSIYNLQMQGGFSYISARAVLLFDICWYRTLLLRSANQTSRGAKVHIPLDTRCSHLLSLMLHVPVCRDSSSYICCPLA
jgi:hypothetical protein